jgi:hypothetical protein
MKKSIFTIIFFFVFVFAYCQEQNQSEIEQISETIMLYIDGTANGEPDKLKKSFHPDFNLYTITIDSLLIRSGRVYISNVK